MNRYARLCVCIALLHATSARAAIMREDVPSSAYEAYATNFPSVGWINATTAEGGTFISGSGELIAPSWVITAGHVARDPNFGTINGLSFSFSTSIFTQPSDFDVADAWYVNPSYVPGGSVTQPTDLALIHLSAPIVGVVPATITSTPLAHDMPVSMVGYGTPGYDSTGLLPYDGLKRGGTNLISGFGGEFTSANYLSYDPTFMFTQFDDVFDGQTALEYQASKHDSGGGIFLSDGSLAAIMTFVNGTQTPGDFLFHSTGAVQLAAYRTWINDTISIPEPSVFALFVAVTPAFVFPTRRKRPRS